MKKILFTLLTMNCLALAAAPWLLAGSLQDLVPAELRQEQARYEAAVTTAQGATLAAMRHAPSLARVAPVGTLPVSTAPAMPAEPVETDAFTPLDRRPATEAALGEAVASTLIVRTLTPTTLAGSAQASAGPGPVLSGIRPTGRPAAANTATPTPQPAGPAWGATPPPGAVGVEDIITAEALAAQLRQEAEGSGLSDLKVSLAADGIQILSTVAPFPGIPQSIRAIGSFTVAQNSLLIEISSITLGGQDVTRRYAAQLESRLNSSLYRLLPGRYVQSFSPAPGQVVVHSQVKP